MDGARLSPHQLMDDKKWVPSAAHRGHTGRSREEKGVYEARSEMGLQ